MKLLGTYWTPFLGESKAQKFAHSNFKDWSFNSSEIFTVFFRQMKPNWSISSKIRTPTYRLEQVSIVNTLMMKKLNIS